MNGRPRAIPEGTDIVVEAKSLFHAQTLVAVLADHDIQAMAAPDIQHGAGIHPDAATGPVPVIARLPDVVEARRILEDVARTSDDMDWDAAIGDTAPPPTFSPGVMPLIARFGLVAGLLIVALMLIGVVLMLVS